ncbi:RNA polymerase Rpc34 subunit-domain-containing protein [Scenedesmus sp. NREL 46B-D3]|nr:RNA polymerase Rpc34 subunit-domain-containing protein [Scenedesmus sp. NREL 46B-D3]
MSAAGSSAAMESDPQVEAAILQLCLQHPEGVGNDLVTGPSGPLAHMDLAVRVTSLNVLLRSGKVSMFKQGTTLLYKATQPQDNRTKGLSAEELLVYQVIKQAGNTGVWTRDLKVRTNLSQPQSLIKSVKNVNNPSRKLYMLFELEPSREITGGAWYTDRQLDREFIEVLRETCFKLVERSESPHICLADIAHFVKDKGLSRIELREEDFLTIMETLIADGRIESIESADEGEPERYRTAVLAVPASTPFTAIPCGVCPVMDQCCEGSQISPQTCVYYSTWLDF